MNPETVKHMLRSLIDNADVQIDTLLAIAQQSGRVGTFWCILQELTDANYILLVRRNEKRLVLRGRRVVDAEDDSCQPQEERTYPLIRISASPSNPELYQYHIQDLRSATDAKMMFAAGSGWIWEFVEGDEELPTTKSEAAKALLEQSRA